MQPSLSPLPNPGVRLESAWSQVRWATRSLLLMTAAGTIVVSLVGCTGEVEFKTNLVELRKQETIAGYSFAAQHTLDIHHLMENFFGTPANPLLPRIPSRLTRSDRLDLEDLMRAAGHVHSDEEGQARGLYREHCVNCHGLSGDGAGPNAMVLNPYPRDFRLGKFKFKSTTFGEPPTKNDIVQIIRNGIPGTAMPSFRALETQVGGAKEIDVLADYVRYLAIRGRVERALIYETSLLDEDERLADFQWQEDGSVSDSQQSLLDELADEFVLPEIQRFFNANDKRTVVPEFPANPLSNEKKGMLLERGKELFHNNVGNCSTCHGRDGQGMQLEKNWDDWTKDWTTKGNLDPSNTIEIQPMLDLGALPPRVLPSRDLTKGGFRGGSRREDLYLRIKNGIDGSGMPPAYVGLTDDDIWSLVEYVRMLAQIPKEEEGVSP